MRARWAALLALACGTPPAPLTAPSADAIVDEAGGAQIVFLPRATDGRLWLSLWIDAGARDADPPQLATVAAWTAARGASLEARVLPDGIEVSRPCARDELEECVRSLGEVVRARAPDDEVLAEAMRRLTERGRPTRWRSPRSSARARIRWARRATTIAWTRSAWANSSRPTRARAECSSSRSATSTRGSSDARCSRASTGCRARSLRGLREARRPVACA